MTGIAVAVLLLGVLGLGLVYAARAVAASRETDDLAVLRLRFPKRLAAASVEAFAASLAGLRLPWWRTAIGSPIVAFEVAATSAGITHHLVVHRRRAGQIKRMLRAHMGDVRVDNLNANARRTSADRLTGGRGTSYRLSTTSREMRLAPAEVSAGLLHAMSSLRRGEIVAVQWIVTPTNPPALPVVRPASSTSRVGRTEVASAAAATALRHKARLPEFHGSLRIVAATGDSRRERALIRRVEGALHPTTAPGVHLRRRRLPERSVARAASWLRVPLGPWLIRLNAAELGQLLAWPIDAVDVPGVHLAGLQRPVPASVPAAGSVIGEGYANGSPRNAALDHDARTRHVALVGPTGAGKSNLMLQLALADAAAGHGVLVVDPKRTLADDVLRSLPASQRHRVCVLDPSDAEHPVGINPLAARRGDREAAVATVFSVMHRVWADSWGIRSADLLHQGLRSLLVDPDATLIDLLPLFLDPSFRARIVARQRDPIVRMFWNQFNALSAGEQAQHIGPMANKLRQLFGRPSLRRVFAQSDPPLDLVEHLNSGGIVVASLNAASVGEEAAGLYGSVLLGLIWTGMQARAAIPASQRRPWSLHIDELGRLVDLPVPIEAFLATARGFDVSLVLALQHLAQLPPDLRAGVLSNVRSLVSFQLNAADAKLLAPYHGSGVTAEDLQGLERFEVAARLHAAGRTQPPCTLTTLPPPKGTGTPAQLRAVSARRWGANGAAVEAAIAERLGLDAEQGSDLPAGRKRRQP